MRNINGKELSDFAIPDDGNLIRQNKGFIQTVGNKQDACLLFLLNAEQFTLHLFPRKVVKGRKGLIHHDKGRMIRQCACNGRSVLHATGKLRRKGFFKASQAHHINNALNLLRLYFLSFEAKGNILRDAQPGHEPRLLEDKGRLMRNAKENLPAVRRLKPADDAQQRRLSAAALAKQDGNLLFRDIQINPFEHRQLPAIDQIGLLYIFKFNPSHCAPSSQRIYGSGIRTGDPSHSRRSQ